MILFEKSDEQTFTRLVQLNQKSILSLMTRLMRESGYASVVHTNAYVYGEGNIPVALVAHADTVFEDTKTMKPVYFDRQQNVCWSPEGLGADDRAGIYSILRILKTGLRPHIIITTDEECGCVGALKLVGKEKLCPFSDIRFMIQLDRRGTNDCVFYDCANDEFTTFIESYGFKSAFGSFSDISVIAPAWGVAAVNLSIGYKNEHSVSETLNIAAMCDTIERVIKILTDVQEHLEEIPLYEYKENSPAFWENWNGGYSYGWGYGNESYFSECDGCHQKYDDTELGTFFFQKEKPQKHILTNNLCLECFSKISTRVHWCSKCGKSWVFEKDSADELEAQKQGASWTCPLCKPEEKANETNVKE